MGELFLPFTPNGKATELLAIEVKRRLDLEPATPVDPIGILSRIPARLIEPRELMEGCPETAQTLFVEYAEQWSGIGLGQSPDDGAALLLLNPTHAMTRRRATLMEEIVHIVMRHPKSTLIRAPGAIVWRRSHDAQIEDEAFTVGAACLLPYPDMFRAIRDAHETAESIAGRFGVSVPYVEFRIKRAGLTNFYRKHCPAAQLRLRRRVR